MTITTYDTCRRQLRETRTDEERQRATERERERERERETDRQTFPEVLMPPARVTITKNHDTASDMSSGITGAPAL